MSDRGSLASKPQRLKARPTFLPSGRHVAAKRVRWYTRLVTRPQEVSVMVQTTRALLFLLVASWGGTLAANPMWVSMSTGVQVPETMHIQVTAMYDGSYGAGDARPLYVMRDGVKLTFVPGTFSIAENTGSGVIGVDAYQICDCDMEPGAYTYHFVYDEETSTYDQVQDVKVIVVTPPPAPAKPQPIPEGEEVYPWEIPSDPWPKGVDCVQFCKTAPVEPVADEGTGETDVTALPDIFWGDLAVQTDLGGSLPDSNGAKPDGSNPASDVLTTGDAKGGGVPEETSKGCFASATGGNVAGVASLAIMMLGLSLLARRRRG